MIKHLYDIFANAWLKDCDSIYVYSDPHFGDLASYTFRGLIDVPIDTFYADEDFKNDVRKLDEMQIKNINSVAGKTSCLIILGDVGDIECVKKLKAEYKVLIMGNHDKGASNYKRVIKSFANSSENKGESFTVVFMGQRVFEKVHPADIDITIEDNHLFDEVYEGPLMINDRVILSHEPIDVPEYMFNIHGHVHNINAKDDSHHLNCCAEVINYKPINLTYLLKKGLLKDVDSIHRETIDKAIARKVV